MTEAAFGRYLATVQERDVDLLLIEEFHVCPEFVSWFCAQTGLGDVSFVGAWHSVADSHGETDLLLLVNSGDRCVGVLIENKIAAQEQPDQDMRYHIRGDRAKSEGLYNDYTTCICAPEVYLAALSSSSQYVFRISYEKIRDWYAAQSGVRFAWRRLVMDEAIEQGRRGYTMIVDETSTRFHRDYWEWITRKHPRLTMREPTPKGKKSNWIILRSPDMPKGVSISHKNNQGCVELTFDRTTLSELLAAKDDWPADIVPQQKGTTTVLGIRVPKLDKLRRIADQEENVEIALAAAERLLEYRHILQSARSAK